MFSSSNSTAASDISMRYPDGLLCCHGPQHHEQRCRCSLENITHSHQQTGPATGIGICLVKGGKNPPFPLSQGTQCHSGVGWAWESHESFRFRFRSRDHSGKGEAMARLIETLNSAHAAPSFLLSRILEEGKYLWALANNQPSQASVLSCVSIHEEKTHRLEKEDGYTAAVGQSRERLEILHVGMDWGTKMLVPALHDGQDPSLPSRSFQPHSSVPLPPLHSFKGSRRQGPKRELQLSKKQRSQRDGAPMAHPRHTHGTTVSAPLGKKGLRLSGTLHTQAFFGKNPDGLVTCCCVRSQSSDPPDPRMEAFNQLSSSLACDELSLTASRQPAIPCLVELFQSLPEGDLTPHEPEMLQNKQETAQKRLLRKEG